MKKAVIFDLIGRIIAISAILVMLFSVYASLQWLLFDNDFSTLPHDSVVFCVTIDIGRNVVALGFAVYLVKNWKRLRPFLYSLALAVFFFFYHVLGFLIHPS
jgi:hypothetical protein